MEIRRGVLWHVGGRDWRIVGMFLGELGIGRVFVDMGAMGYGSILGLSVRPVRSLVILDILLGNVLGSSLKSMLEYP